MKHDTVENLSQAIESAKVSWLSGRSFSPQNLEFTQGCSDKNAQMHLLAIAGQLKHITRLQVDADFEDASVFPTPELPFLLDDLRPIFSRIVAKLSTNDDKIAVIRLLHRRGYIAHPFDWLPSALTDALPEVYNEILAWQAGVKQGEGAELTCENWATFYPAERLSILKSLRESNPQAALNLIESEISNESPDDRVKLIALFENKLSTSDAAFLTQLVQSDRSGKVKTRAKAMLARLGGFDAGGDYSGLEYIEVARKGILKRKTTLRQLSKLTQAQQSTLFDQLDSMQAIELANYFDMSQDELVMAWDIDGFDAQFHSVFARCIFNSGSEAACEALWLKFCENALAHLFELPKDAWSRVSQKALYDGVSIVISQSSRTLMSVLHEFVMRGVDEFTDALSHQLLASHWTNELLAQVKEQQNSELTKRNQNAMELELRLFGLLLNANDAEKLMQKLKNIGLSGSDPALETLNLNIKLIG